MNNKFFTERDKAVILYTLTYLSARAGMPLSTAYEATKTGYIEIMGLPVERLAGDFEAAIVLAKAMNELLVDALERGAN